MSNPLDTNNPSTHNSEDSIRSLDLRLLTAEQAQHIDELLAGVGEDGEVHLFMQKGELRYRATASKLTEGKLTTPHAYAGGSG